MNVVESLSRKLFRDRDARLAAARSECGASAVEYGLLIAGIAAVIAAVIFAMGGGSNGMYQKSCDTIFEDTSTGSCD
jgi:pilus assembly protein Flp/PilA